MKELREEIAKLKQVQSGFSYATAAQRQSVAMLQTKLSQAASSDQLDELKNDVVNLQVEYPSIATKLRSQKLSVKELRAEVAQLQMVARSYVARSYTHCKTKSDACLVLDGMVFSTLDGTSFSDTSVDCQSSWLPLPIGWAIATSANAPSVAGSHPWGTDILCFGSPGSGRSICWWTKTFSGVKAPEDFYWYKKMGNTYKPDCCDCRILIERSLLP